jgi:uncharacterized protein (TIGR01319 family)
MMTTALLIDFGSTYTKLRAINMKTAEIIGSGQGPSTVTTDVNLGLDAALSDLEDRLGRLPNFTLRLASSSAAGGLSMVTVGLVKDLTAKAARMAALGAGAKVVGNFFYELTEEDIDAIVAFSPDILLLSGGTDGGNKNVILQNANALAQCDINCPIVVAGNRSAASDVRKCLELASKRVIVTENVMPEYLKLNIESAREKIRQIFIEHIIHAKGIDRAADRFDAVLMPTPAAVLEGARLLADGTASEPGLGALMVIDIGGATTDVHSICDGAPVDGSVVYQGLPEPYAKRTVEGDMGMRYTAASVVRKRGLDQFSKDAGLSSEQVKKLLNRTQESVDWLPETSVEHAFDLALARTAVRTSVTHHAGHHSVVQGASGPVTVQRGKDLRNIKLIIGTGGVLVHGRDPREVLNAALANPRDNFSLRPRSPEFVLDSEYILYSCGLLRESEPDVAFHLGKTHLNNLGQEHEYGIHAGR